MDLFGLNGSQRWTEINDQDSNVYKCCETIITLELHVVCWMEGCDVSYIGM